MGDLLARHNEIGQADGSLPPPPPPPVEPIVGPHLTMDGLEPMTLQAGQRIGITCDSARLAMNGTVQATIDGEVVLERSNGISDGFDRVALLFYPAREGDSVLFDNVIAEVP